MRNQDGACKKEEKSILKDEDAMDEGVADKLKKRKSYDTNKDKGPSAGSDRGGKSTQAEETVFEARDTQGQHNLGEDMGNINEPPVVNVDPKVGLRNQKDLLLQILSGIKKKLNISRPMMHKAGIAGLKPYSAHFKPQGFIYVDKLGRNRLICSHKLYKFSDGTLISLRDTLKDMANNLEMGYTSVMPRRRWSNLDNKRSHIMIKYINRQLLDRRLMRSLEKFVGGRYYGEDPRLLQRTI
ncbi:hypothetical protein Tco_0916746 [Tanacetum coccineum]